MHDVGAPETPGNLVRVSPGKSTQSSAGNKKAPVIDQGFFMYLHLRLDLREWHCIHCVLVAQFKNVVAGCEVCYIDLADLLAIG